MDNRRKDTEIVSGDSLSNINRRIGEMEKEGYVSQGGVALSEERYGNSLSDIDLVYAIAMVKMVPVDHNE